MLQFFIVYVLLLVGAIAAQSTIQEANKLDPPALTNNDLTKSLQQSEFGILEDQLYNIAYGNVLPNNALKRNVGLEHIAELMIKWVNNNEGEGNVKQQMLGEVLNKFRDSTGIKQLVDYFTPILSTIHEDDKEVDKGNFIQKPLQQQLQLFLSKSNTNSSVLLGHIESLSEKDIQTLQGQVGNIVGGKTLKEIEKNFVERITNKGTPIINSHLQILADIMIQWVSATSIEVEDKEAKLLAVIDNIWKEERINAEKARQYASKSQQEDQRSQS
jgi:hypothetical protein